MTWRLGQRRRTGYNTSGEAPSNMPCAGGAAFAKVTRKWFRRAHGFRVGTRPSDRNHKRNSISVAAQDGCQRFQSRHLVGRDADSGASRHANFLVRRSLAHDRTAEARTYAGAIKPLCRIPGRYLLHHLALPGYALDPAAWRGFWK